MDIQTLLQIIGAQQIEIYTLKAQLAVAQMAAEAKKDAN